MAEPDKETLRREVLDALTNIESAQNGTWRALEIAVHGAHAEFLNKRVEILEERVRELATAEKPMLLEAVMGLLMTAVPVQWVVSGLMAHYARTLEIGRVTGAFIPPKQRPKLPGYGVVRQPPPPPPSLSPSRLPVAAQTVELRPIWVPSGQHRFPHGLALGSKEKFVREVKEYDESLQRFAEIYTDEFADTVRATVKAAASQAVRPVVPQEQMFDGAPDRPSAARPSTGTPAAGFFVGLLKAIARSQNANAKVISELRNAVITAQDLQSLKMVKKFVDQPVFNTGTPLKIDYDAFQRFIEVCFWCTTWDFRPRFQPARRADPFRLRGATPAQFVLPPLGQKFWDYATRRYCDPFFGDGSKTYLEIGRSRQLGAVSLASMDPEVARYVNSGGIDPGFYPAERLAFHFGNVIAPELLSLNFEIASVLERQGAVSLPRSEPTELDRFYRAMAEVMKLGK